VTKKQEIFAEAARLFQEKGYNAASMRDLAERVHLKASSLYSHIRKKEEILQKICFDHAGEFTRGMAKVEKMQTSPAGKVRELLSLHIRTALEDPTAVTVFSDEWKHLEEPFLSQFLDLRRDYEQRFLLIIEEGIRQGQFRAVEPRTALYTLLSAIRWLHHRPRPDNPKSLTDELCALLMGGLET
jgi:TetR/AcrR family transcriptional regulator, cholesterol catabolism regulator